MLESFHLAWHIVVRNWRVYAKDFVANISPTLAEPALVLVALGAGLGPLVTGVDGHSYAKFLAPGIAMSTALFTAFFETSYGFYVRLTYESIYKAMLTTPIGVREIIIGELTWVFLKGAAMATTVSIVLVFFGLFTYLPWLLAMPLIGGLVALPCGAIGLMSSALVRNINQFQSVYSFIIAPLYFLSGIFFPVTTGPAWFQLIVHFSPLYHGARLAQMAFWNEFHGLEALGHVTSLLLYAVLFITLASRLIHKKLIL